MGGKKVRDMNLVTTESTARAVIAILENIRPQILRYRANVAKLKEVLEQILGFRWDRSIICAAGME